MTQTGEMITFRVSKIHAGVGWVMQGWGRVGHAEVGHTGMG